MKPSYSIGARNGLLDQKHFNALGHAVWLYLWFLDKQPKDTDKVLGGQPITFEMFAEQFPKVSRRTFTYWMRACVEGGYISTLRTPHGSVITISKPKKWADAQEVAHHDAQQTAHGKSDAQKMSSDAQKMVKSCAKNDASNIKETITNNNKHSNTTDVVLGADAPVRYGKPEINELFDYWAEQVGYEIQSRIQANRRAASTMLKKHGADKLKQLIKGVALAQKDRYAPRIADLSQLQQKQNDLIAWGHKQTKATNSGRGVKI